MRIAMIGTGYVGLVSGACFAELGHDVVCVDIDPGKIDALKNGTVPIYEPGLKEMVAKAAADGRLSFTTEIHEAVPRADAVFIAVGTPTRPEDGHADLRYVYAAAESVATAITGYTVIVDKSTVPVGTAREVADIIGRTRDASEFDVVSNPEFLREGAAIGDFMKPDRIVVGARTERATQTMRAIYAPLTDQGHTLLVTDPESAELIKYAANAFLATKIGFINEIADICEKTGADVLQVAEGIGLDTRIGNKFLMPGPGFGGSCFPKDTRELAASARESGAPSRIVEAVMTSNDVRKRAMAERVAEVLGEPIRNKRIAVLGLTFKAETDDMRESPAIDIVAELTLQGANVAVHDPKGMDIAQSLIDDVEWAKTPYDAVRAADTVLIVTEWKDYRELDWTHVKELMQRPIVVDLRNLFDGKAMQELGFLYASVGRPIVGHASEHV